MYTTHWDHIYIWQPPWFSQPTILNFTKRRVWNARAMICLPGLMAKELSEGLASDPRMSCTRRASSGTMKSRKLAPFKVAPGPLLLKGKPKKKTVPNCANCYAVCAGFIGLEIRISIWILSWIPGMDRLMQRSWRAVPDQKCGRIFKNVHATWVRFCCVGPG